MIEYRNMDITSVECGIVAHGVNCQKKMGSGVALAIRKKWPKAYQDYLKGKPHLGRICWSDINANLSIANCYTQGEYGYDGSRYAMPIAIKDCFRALNLAARHCTRPTIFMPRIGCGLGGLKWGEDVEPLLCEFYPDTHVIVCDWE